MELRPSDSSPRTLDLAVTLILVIAILPSLTALSHVYFEAFPSLSKLSGPISPAKISLPLIFFYIWLNRKRFPKIISTLLISTLAIGSISTYFAAGNCIGRMNSFREWFVMITGAGLALSFVLLHNRLQRVVVSCWLATLFITAALDYAWPSSITWLYNHVFDPQTRIIDFRETQANVLTGVFGRQSMAKLLAWIPWLFCATWLARPTESQPRLTLTLNRQLMAMATICALGGAMTLATSQRGPFVAVIAGAIVFAIHRWSVTKSHKPILATGVAILTGSIILLLIVPRAVYESRIRVFFGSSPVPAEYTKAAEAASNTVTLRKDLYRYTLQMIAENPRGNVCPPIRYEKGICLSGLHAHNLFLEQFRSRGWLWGSVHAVLWVLAFIGFWRSGSSLSNSFWIGGITTVLVSGLFDHPWFVINHAQVLGVYLVAGLVAL